MNPKTNRNRERGFTLTEVMVATAIMIIVFVGILMLYDRANNVFKTSNESADMQQNLRVAYDRVLADVRMAGFDYKRGGPLMPGQTAAAWAPARAYAAGTIVTPTTPNGKTYRATTSGTSGNVEPTWPTSSGGTYIETGATPDITWQENGGAVYEQPDEQVEYAGATAVTVRGNFDYSANQTGDVDHGREPGLEGANFPVVTTGNDEIVTYALVSNKAPAGSAPNTQSISMTIDINNSGTPTRTAHPGGSAEKTKTITGVDLTNANPPYTLYRFTFDSTGAVQRIPIADNVRSLNFFYYSDSTGQTPLKDAAGALAPDVGGGGLYDPSVAGSWSAPARLVRSRIRAIRVRLVGMSSQPDPKYADTSTAAGIETGMYSSTTTAGVPVFVADTVAPRYRRVASDTLVSPRNLGLTGMPQTYLQPPPQPTITSVCTGYCAITVVNWNPNSNNPNASYVLLWDNAAGGSFSNAIDAGTSNTFAVDLTSEDVSQNFYFKVRAVNQGGQTESPVFGPVVAKNTTTPNPPTSLAATGGGGVPALPGVVRLSWTAPITNASGAPTCSDGATPSVSNFLHEIQAFRVYKSTSPGVPANSGNLIADENTSGAAAPDSDGYGNYTWDDTAVSCGQNYYYRVITVEYCAASGTYNTSNSTSSAISAPVPGSGNGIVGTAGTSGTPGIPVNLTAAPNAPAVPPTGMLASTCSSVSNTCNVSLGWSKVTQDTNGATIAIDQYEIERTQLLGGVPNGAPVTWTITGGLAQPGSTVLYTDNGVPEHDPGFLNYSYRYRVRALQTSPCPSGAFSAYVLYPPPCTFTGSIVVQTGASSGNGLTPATAWVMNGGDTIQVNPPSGTTLVTTTMQMVDPAGVPLTPQSSGTSPALFTWGNQTASTVYTVTFTMTNNAVPACTEQLVRYIQQEPLPACALTTFADTSAVLVNTATNYQLKLDLINESVEPMTLTALKFVWSPPIKITWNSMKFPSAAGATVTGPGTSGTYNVTLSPKPAQLSASDVTVNANNGVRTILLNMAKINGNPANITPAAISSICVQYTIPSQVGLTFSCQIKPDAAANNPTSCN